MSLSSDKTLAKNARWLWADGVSGANHYVEFRRQLDGAPAEAWLQLSAGTSLRLWINGEQIHAGPSREVPPYFYFDTIDLRPHLRAGKDELRIVAHHQGADSQSHQAGTPALLVAGRAGAEDLGDPRGWRARRIARYRADAHRLFSCLGFSEHVDFAADDLPWGAAREIAAHPWSERPVALARDLPQWRETVREPVSCASHEGGWLFDMGMETSGYVELALATPIPVSLVVSYAEALTAGRVDPFKGGMHYADRLDLVAGEVIWRSYEKRAFRFLRLDRAVEVKELRIIEHTWPYERVDGGANAGDALARRIRDVSAHTIELNTEDLLTDCPWRERAQYLDCQFYMGAMKSLFGTLEPIRRFLTQFPRGADATGLLRMCYPSPGGTRVIPDFSMSYAVLLLRYLELGGDLETVRANLPLAERGVTAFRRYEDADGLLADVPGWIFLDNTFELPKFPRSAGLNAVYHGARRALAELCRYCGEPDRASGHEAAAARVRAAFRRTFLRDGRVLDADSTPEHEAHRQWIYHHGAGARGGCFRLRIEFKKRDAAPAVRLAVHGGARAWIDGAPVADIKAGGSWTRSAIYQPVTLPTPEDTEWHVLEIEVEWSGIDWECYLSCRCDVEWRDMRVDGRAAELRTNPWPWMTQTTVGYAAYHGLLEPREARAMLRACLPARYAFPYSKRTTPFFAVIGEAAEARRILPCNVPASLFHFCHALRRYGLGREARELLLPIYAGMLERGATTWWEEWNTGSSLCHAWGSFVVEFLEEDQPIDAASR